MHLGSVRRPTRQTSALARVSCHKNLRVHCGGDGLHRRGLGLSALDEIPPVSRRGATQHRSRATPSVESEWDGPVPRRGDEVTMERTIVPTRQAGAAPSPSRRGRRSPGVLDPRDNSLNLIRLALAGTVLFSHAFPLSGRPEPSWAGAHLGTWAVVGFFVLSGYLVTGSRMRSDGARFLASRLARIFPGYLVSLVVVAFLFAPVAYLVENRSLEGFLTTANTPLNFLLGNAFLRVQDYSVAGTLATAPAPYSWNGSLWSLYFEFLCYVVIGVAALCPVVRRRRWPVALMFVVSVVVHVQAATVSSYLSGNWEIAKLLELLPYFLGGALVFVCRESCPLRWQAAVPALAVSLVVISWQPVWGSQAVAPLIAYTLLWLGSVMPSPQVLKIHDLSYGVYIYAFPVTQLLVLFGVDRYGLPVLLLGVVVGTSVLAVLSWLLVERPAKDLLSGRRAARRAERSALAAAFAPVTQPLPERRPAVQPSLPDRAAPTPTPSAVPAARAPRYASEPAARRLAV
ncbi:acyltransferase family protein [Geodermatophilus sp. SYSU D01180]